VSEPVFHRLVPGTRFPGDWCDAAAPMNIEVGENCAADSTDCFKRYRPRDRIGLRLGRDVTLWRTSLAVEAEGLVEIGDASYLANAILVAAERITLGAGVFVGVGATLIDCDFHPLSPAERLADSVAVSPLGDWRRRPKFETRPIVIGDDVWIGHHATILKGVRIGRGAVVEPGALVTRDVPEGAVVAGNPAAPVDRGSAP
jgi:acetyltransferase-like isoleucine patch superfamily enzyme